jgi:CxxC-x17-CxxC domain-containing protein
MLRSTSSEIEARASVATPSAVALDPTLAQRELTTLRVIAMEDRESVFDDRTLTCRDCGEAFVFSAGEQSFFASKGLQNDPQRCPTCRAAAKRARTVGGPREYHAAVCAMCGGQAVVPFAPRNDRPVYCSSCFDKVRAEPVATA